MAGGKSMAHGTPFITEAQVDVMSADQLFFADLTDLNATGVDGSVIVALNGNELTVFVGATGLTPGQMHPQHIHGFLSDEIKARTPTIAFDRPEFGGDGDGYVELAEGLNTYGPVIKSLTPFPTAPDGTIRYAVSYNLSDQELADLGPLSLREYVVHGANVLSGVGEGTPGEVDGTGGYIAILPVGSGELKEVGVTFALSVLAEGGAGRALPSEGDALRPVSNEVFQGFDRAFYLAVNPDVAAAGVDPLSHFNTFGFKEGRDPNSYFDTSAYLEVYTDVAAAGVNPLEHYFQYGAREGRDPSAAFDTNQYLTAYTDVAAAGVNPLQHFLQFGIYEGRQTFGDGSLLI